MLTRPIPRLVSLALLWVFILLFTTSVTASTPVPPIPGTSFETARSLGLTTTSQTGPVGINLKTNDDLGYYFYLAPDRDTSLTFTFYTYQPVSDYESRLRKSIALLVVYDASQNEIIGKPTLTCTLSYSSPSRKACTATLASSLKGGQGYYLFVNFHTFDDPSVTENRIDAKDYEGWLTWKALYTRGTSALQPWPWFKFDTLRGQIDVKGEHWYLVNVSPGSRLEFTLWGSSNLDLCVYRTDDPVRPLGCSAKTAYPKVTPTITPPSDILGQAKLLVKVTNQDVRNIEYYLSYTRK